MFVPSLFWQNNHFKNQKVAQKVPFAHLHLSPHLCEQKRHPIATPPFVEVHIGCVAESNNTAELLAVPHHITWRP